VSLNAKQQRFVNEYLIDFNATQAAIRAGYSKKTAQMIGSENLSKPIIAEAIDIAMKAKRERNAVTADRVLAELAKIGFADITRAVEWGEALSIESMNGDGEKTGEPLIVQGVAMIASAKLAPEVTAAISEVRKTKDGISIKFHDKTAALLNMGKHLGLFTDKLELTGKDGGPIQITDLDRAKALAVFLAKTMPKKD
jgi:phage terminase small subunit